MGSAVRKLFVGSLLTAAAIVLMAVPAAAAPPFADSGPDQIAEAGTDAVLDGSASDPDGDSLQIRWLLSVIADGDLSTCTFSGPTAYEPISAAGLAPTFNCTEPGDYLLQLVAADATSFFDSLGALVTFTEPMNSPPIVDSGPDQSAPAGTDVVLAGSASDPDGDALEIRWIRTVVFVGDLTSCTFSGPTSFEPISAAGLAPTFNCTTPGDYLLQLVAGDGITSVDDTGALVSFTEPIDDFTAPTCMIGSYVEGVSATIIVADPETGVASIDARLRFRASATPELGTFDPPTPSVTTVVTRTPPARNGLAFIFAVNGDDDVAVCFLIIPRTGAPYLA